MQLSLQPCQTAWKQITWLDTSGKHVTTVAQPGYNDATIIVTSILQPGYTDLLAHGSHGLQTQVTTGLLTFQQDENRTTIWPRSFSHIQIAHILSLTYLFFSMQCLCDRSCCISCVRQLIDLCHDKVSGMNGWTRAFRNHSFFRCFSASCNSPFS